jgi:mercuric reductase
MEHEFDLRITGMSGEDCAQQVESALREAGAQRAVADWRHGAATAVGELDPDRLERGLSGTRYAVADIREETGTRDRDWDLVVVGSGGGAFAAAIRARDLGRRVLMVEHGTTGGTCVNVGCIPSKALLVGSERARLAGAPTLGEALAAKGELVQRLRQTKYIDLLDRYAIAFRAAEARLADAHTVLVDGEPVTAGAILIAAGARPAVPAIPGSGRLVGASILAAGAPDVIQSAVLAIDRGITVNELARSWAPYLTMAEGLKLAAQTFERDVATLSCCAA